MWRQLLGRFYRRSEEVLPPPVTVQPVGVVHNRVRQPRPWGWERVRSKIVIRPELTAALDGIEGYSHITVVFWMHRVSVDARSLIHIHPRGDHRYPLQGVLATRSQNRPNPIGVAVVPLLKRQGNVLWVRGLDAINGTPVLDIKPYIPYYDSVAQARVPDWVLGRAEGPQS